MTLKTLEELRIERGVRKQTNQQGTMNVLLKFYSKLIRLGQGLMSDHCMHLNQPIIKKSYVK